MIKKKRITIKDVARDAGVGLGTASRAINGSPDVSPETRMKVLNSVKKLGYVPDRLAQGMRSRRYRNIALIVGDISNIVFAQIAKEIQIYLEGQGYTLSLCNTGDNNVAEKIEAFLQGRKLDGIILSIPDESDVRVHEVLRQANIPAVTIDREIPGIPMGIVTDYYSSIKQATKYLLSLGHTGIVIATGSRFIRPTRVCIDGYRDAFLEAGKEPREDLICSGDLTAEYGSRLMERLLPQIRAREVTAVISLNNGIFTGIMEVIRRYGLDYPRDVSLISVEDTDMTRILKPAITVVRRSFQDMAAKSAQNLLHFIENQGEVEIVPMYIPTEFIIRESCNPVY